MSYCQDDDGINFEEQKYAKPICLPNADDAGKFVSETEFLTSGWGLTGPKGKGARPVVLQMVRLPWQETDVCKSWHPKPHTVVDERHICAGGIIGFNTCDGDSGGKILY